jgi:hypothetical protein
MMSAQPTDYTELQQNPDNWRLYVFYVCREDPRIIVPKRFRITGWTMNFAHREAYLLFAALLALVIVPITVVEVTGLSEISWLRPTTIVVSVLAAFALTWWAGELQKSSEKKHT